MGELLLNLGDLAGQVCGVDASDTFLHFGNININAGSFDTLSGCFWFVVNTATPSLGGFGESDRFFGWREKVQP